MQATYTLLPGLHGTSELYAPLIAALKPHSYEAIEYPTDQAQDYDSLVHWLDQTLDWNIPRIFIAESFSGPIAMRLAAMHPDSAQQLVLAASFCAPPTTPNLALLPLRPFFVLSPPKKALKHFLVGNNAPPAQLDQLKTIIQKIPSKALTARIRSVLGLRPEDCPPLKSTPILILQASDDNLIPWATQNQLRLQYPEAETHWISSPHLLLQNQAEECAQHISEFVSQHSPSYA
ncbi:alpha/beta fold hydrolase [Rubritalea tangerina]|uniref:Alpha/beta fold hydrolase n=1 Tax=Rubritalea tangerina TaxID=430798 RepID=A0ABW4ZCH2_9BACT